MQGAVAAPPHIARVAPLGWKQSHTHAEPMSPQAKATEPTTVSVGSLEALLEDRERR